MGGADLEQEYFPTLGGAKPKQAARAKAGGQTSAWGTTIAEKAPKDVKSSETPFEDVKPPEPRREAAPDNDRTDWSDDDVPLADDSAVKSDKEDQWSDDGWGDSPSNAQLEKEKAAEEERLREEAEARKREEEELEAFRQKEEARRRKEEEADAARRREEEEESRRQQEEEDARRRQDEEEAEARRLQEEKEARERKLQAEEEDRKRKEQEEQERA